MSQGTKSKTGSNQQLITKISQLEKQKQNVVDRLLNKRVADELQKDPQFKKLLKSEQMMRGKIHRNKLNLVRKTKAAKRLEREAKAKRAEVPVVKKKLDEYLASLVEIEARRDKLIETKQAQMQSTVQRAIKAST